MLNIKVVTWSLALWSAFSFVFCVAFAMLTPSSLSMHALLLQLLPGFEWYSWRGFLVGLIESFLYGAYAGLVYVPIYNFLHRRWGIPRLDAGVPNQPRTLSREMAKEIL